MIISAETRHIEQVADIFCEAFLDSINFFTRVNEDVKNAIKEMFNLLLLVYGQGFMVAIEENEVCGYIVMVDNIKKLWFKAITTGFFLKMAYWLVSRKIVLDGKNLLKIIKNKIFYMKFEVSTPPSAQILSIAVAQKYRQMGIGKSLVKAGIDFIDSLCIKRIKLEVRPENTAALTTYKRFGFKQIGKTKDLQGNWLIMVRETD